MGSKMGSKTVVKELVKEVGTEKAAKPKSSGTDTPKELQGEEESTSGGKMATPGY